MRTVPHGWLSIVTHSTRGQGATTREEIKNVYHVRSIISLTPRVRCADHPFSFLLDTSPAPGGPADREHVLDLRQLEILRAIAETGSFTRAGARLHVSQSAVSRQILLLEEELNERLFIRLGQRVQITPTGESILQLSHRLFADIRETCGTIMDRQKALTGTIDLAGGMTVCLYLFPRLLKEFRRHHPEVEVKITTGGMSRILRRIRTGRSDLALLTLPIEEPGLTTVPVLREELLLIMPPGHRLLDLKHPLAPSALVAEEFIVFERGSNTRRAIDDFFVREQIKPRVVAETENAEIMKAMVASGLGISIVPFQAVANEIRTGALSVARIQGRQLVRETGWVYRTSERLPRVVQEMMATLTQLSSHLQLSTDERMDPILQSPKPRRKSA